MFSSRLGLQLFAVFAFFIIVFAAVLGVGLVRLNEMRAITEQVGQSDWVKASLTFDLSYLAKDSEAASLELLVAPVERRDALKQQIAHNHERTRGHLTTIAALLYTADSREILERVQKLQKVYENSLTQLTTSLEQGSRDDAITVFNTQTVRVRKLYQEKLEAMRLLLQKEVETSTGKGILLVGRISWEVGIIGAVALVMGLLGAAIVVSRTLAQLGSDPH